MADEQRQKKTTHGLSGTRTWFSWQAMHRRCSNPRVAGWKDYGGRGIVVCERWNEFENFLADMGERPAKTSLDRINVDGNYDPNNCRWASAKVQAANTRRAKAKALTLKGSDE